MTHTLRLDWTGNSGESYIEVLVFSVDGSKVTTMATSAMANGVILTGGPRSWTAFTTLTVEKARRVYRRRLDQGYKPAAEAPALRYRDQPA